MISTALLTLLALMALAIPVAASMGVLGLMLGQFFAFLPVSRAAGEIAWTSSNEFLLVSLPLFIVLRVLYIMMYVAGIPTVRSAVWTLALLVNIGILYNGYR